MAKVVVGSTESKAKTLASKEITRLSGKKGNKYNVAILGYDVKGKEFTKAQGFHSGVCSFVEGIGRIQVTSEEHAEVLEDHLIKYGERAMVPVLTVPIRKKKLDAEELAEGNFGFGYLDLTVGRFAKVLSAIEDGGKDFTIEMGDFGAITITDLKSNAVDILKKKAPGMYQGVVQRAKELDDACQRELGKKIPVADLEHKLNKDQAEANGTQKVTAKDKHARLDEALS